MSEGVAWAVALCCVRRTKVSGESAEQRRCLKGLPSASSSVAMSESWLVLCPLICHLILSRPKIT